MTENIFSLLDVCMVTGACIITNYSFGLMKQYPDWESVAMERSIFQAIIPIALIAGYYIAKLF